LYFILASLIQNRILLLPLLWHGLLTMPLHPTEGLPVFLEIVLHPLSLIYQESTVVAMERYRIQSEAAVYFVTYSIVEWLPVFIREATCKIVTEPDLLPSRKALAHQCLRYYADAHTRDPVRCRLRYGTAGANTRRFPEVYRATVERLLRESSARVFPEDFARAGNR
jgi:hypothetical protein